MPDPNVAKTQEWLRAHEQDLLDDLVALLKIPSLQSDPLPNAPFGKANREALDYVLARARGWGMRTVDLDGYIGYAEFGEGDGEVLVLGHLDVVPVGPGWKHEPFGAEIDGGYIYARGTADDKGPAVAAFYAARAIQECVPGLKARVRVAFGCNEESGFKCVERYVKTEAPPTFGVAPDAEWPLVHAEKGIANFIVEAPLPGGEFELMGLTGGQRPNIVIDHCEAKLRVADAIRTEIEGKLAEAWDRNVEAIWSDGELALVARGKAAHGAMPFSGDSAAIRVLRLLKEIAPMSSQKAYETLFSMTHIAGDGLGIGSADPETGALSCNLGIVGVVDGRLRMTFNVRYPVDQKGTNLRARCEKRLAEYGVGYVLQDFHDSPPLYFPINHPLVKTICEVVHEETGEDKKPGTMGGGTYARAVANTVAIGTCWDGDGPAHETDERMKLEHLFRASRIYAHLLLRLVEMAGN